MCFSGVTLALIPLVKPVSPVSAEKSDRSLRCLCTSISYGACASDWVNMFVPFLKYFFLMDYLWHGTINVVYSSVSWSSIFFSKSYL